MKTELKDVLHLYLGCQVQTNYRRETTGGSPMKKLKGTLQEIDLYMPDKCGVLLEDQSDKTHYSNLDIKTVKPILRPLSDMTEKEWLKEMPDRPALKPGYELNFSATQFNWLLKQGFDLFGLIESGQAIDKTKL